jgi:phosphoribosylanthranilate isomerase
LAIDCGADALGLVSAMPSGPGVIDDQRIAEIAAVIPPSVASFLLTARTDADAIADQVTHARTSTVQLVDWVGVDVLRQLKTALPRTKIVQVLHVEDDAVLAQADTVAPHVDAILLDSGRPNAAVPELGGTGRVHDWDLSAKVVASSAVPVFLAGGLHAGNVRAAIDTVRPYGIDLCSGVRVDGQLQRNALMNVVRAITPAQPGVAAQ